MISEVKMPVVAWQYRSEDPFDCGQLMLSEEEPARREKAPLVLQSDALAAIEAARVEHEKVLKDLRWRMDDIRNMLMKEGYNGERIYGCDEWSTPTVNLQKAIDLIDRSLAAASMSPDAGGREGVR